MWTKYMDTQDLVILFLADNFNKALFFAQNPRFAGCGKRKLSYFNLVSHLARPGLRQPHRSNFRIAICAAGHEPEIYRLHALVTGNVFNCHNSFFRSEVSKQRCRDYVTDRINSWLSGLHILVNLNE